VNHSRNFVDPSTGACTNGAENLWGRAKERNRDRHGTHRHMLDSYLCEFMWRSRLGSRNPFVVIIEDIASFFLTNINE